MALFCSRPLLVEAACRARTLQATELYRIRSAWSGLVSIVSLSPLVTPKDASTDTLLPAVPEYCFEQPRGMQVIVSIFENKEDRSWFAGGLGRKIGVEFTPLSQFSKHADELNRLLALPRPCLLYTSPSPRDLSTSRMPSSA